MPRGLGGISVITKVYFGVFYLELVHAQVVLEG